MSAGVASGPETGTLKPYSIDRCSVRLCRVSSTVIWARDPRRHPAASAYPLRAAPWSASRAALAPAGVSPPIASDHTGGCVTQPASLSLATGERLSALEGDRVDRAGLRQATRNQRPRKSGFASLFVEQAFFHHVIAFHRASNRHSLDWNIALVVDVAALMQAQSPPSKFVEVRKIPPPVVGKRRLALRAGRDRPIRFPVPRRAILHRPRPHRCSAPPRRGKLPSRLLSDGCRVATL